MWANLTIRPFLATALIVSISGVASAQLVTPWPASTPPPAATTPPAEPAATPARNTARPRTQASLESAPRTDADARTTPQPQPGEPAAPTAATPEPEPPIAEGGVPPAIRVIVTGAFEGARPSPAGEAIRRFYRSRGFAPIWVASGAIGEPAQRLVEAIEAAGSHGLNPAEYRAAELRAMLAAPAEAPRLAAFDVLLTQAAHRYASDIQGARLSSLTLPRDARHVTRTVDPARTLAAFALSPDPAAAITALAPQEPAYARMIAALSHYQQIAAAGGWPTLPNELVLAEGAVDPRVALLRRRLAMTDGAALAGPQGPNTWDSELTAAVKRFQRRHGHAEDGRVSGRTVRALNVPVEQRIRALHVNLDRVRAAPARTNGPEIFVNIPEARLRVQEGERELIAMHVVVGREARATPILSSRITEVKFNPTWTVPLRNAREDFLPRLQRNAQQFVNSSYRIFRGGEQIDPTTVDWTQVTPAAFNYTIRQDAGPRNALGRMRLTLPDTPAIYLHDTPERQYFARDNRAASSGCIRLERPVEMVEFVLRHNAQQWTPDRIRQMMEGNETRHIPVTRPVPVHLVYRTAWVEQNGDVSFRDDIYRIDDLILRRQEQRPALVARGA